jgi:signal transduction histidine kinase
MAKKMVVPTKRAESLKSDGTARALHERIKELTCLYTISQLSVHHAESPESVFQSIVETIPPAWQYPEAAAACIVVDGKSFHSSGFQAGHNKMAAPIIAFGKRRGMVEVVYRQDRPDAGNALFIREERHLIKAIAQHVGFVIERQEVEKEKRELYKQLIHADRLATIGQLAAGVAHELNEPLSNILGFAQLVRTTPGLPEKSKHDVDRIVEASLHAREIIKKLLLFARQLPTKKSKVNLNAIISEALELLEYRFEKGEIELVRHFAPRLPLIVADSRQLKQVIVNLTVNAIQAMPKGGILTVCTAVEGARLTFWIEDTGTGMTEEVLDRIFVPFFTTKDVDQGTGLGLPVVHGIVTSHGGTIAAKSSPGKGTTFTIRLPLRKDTVRRKASV